MKNIFNKSIFAALAVLSISNTTLPFGFEMKMDQDGVTVNGQNIQQASTYKKVFRCCTGVLLEKA